MNGHNVLERDFLIIRASLLDLAAHRDRLDWGPVPDDDVRMAQVVAACREIAGSTPGRAERVQLIFSEGGEGELSEAVGGNEPGKKDSGDLDEAGDAASGDGAGSHWERR